MREQRGTVLLLNKEGCGGGDADLGYECLVTMLEALPERKDKPIAIICWNTAVRLLAKDSPMVSRMKRLEDEGVDILAAKLCVSELELTDKIAVGKITPMQGILDLILHNEVISL